MVFGLRFCLQETVACREAGHLHPRLQTTEIQQRPVRPKSQLYARCIRCLNHQTRAGMKSPKPLKPKPCNHLLRAWVACDSETPKLQPPPRLSFATGALSAAQGCRPGGLCLGSVWFLRLDSLQVLVGFGWIGSLAGL